MSAIKKNGIETVCASILAMMMIIFGLNKFLGFIAVDPPADPTAQQFMGAMFTSYLYIVVAFAEIIGGLLLLFPKTRFVGWLLQGVIIFNIVAFHISHDFIGNGIWIVPTILFLIIGFFQKDKVISLFKDQNVLPQNKLKSAAVISTMLLLSSFSTDAQDNFQSYKVENDIMVNHSSEEVWNLISNFENLPKLVPAVVERTEMNGVGVYASWIIYLKNAQMIKEEMTYFNPTEMEFAYIMTKTGMPISDYLAIQKVERVDDTKSKVIFTTYFNTTPLKQEAINKQFGNFQKTFLNNIKHNIQ